MTRFSRIVLLFIAICLNCDTEAANTRFKYKKVLKNEETLKNKQIEKCNELPIPTLNNILGPAFNSRFGLFQCFC